MIKFLRIVLIIALLTAVFYIGFNWPVVKEAFQTWLNNIAMGN